MDNTDAAQAYERAQLTAATAWEHNLKPTAALHVDDGLSVTEVAAVLEDVGEHAHVWVPVVYGKPAPATIAAAAAGDVILAGCARYPGAPRERCQGCGVTR